MMSATAIQPKAGAGVLATLLLLVVCTPQAMGSEGSDDIWLVNTRRAPHSGTFPSDHQALTFLRWQSGQRWSTANRADFLAACDEAVPTVVFVHGNRTDNAWAVEEAMGIYPYLKRSANGKPFRYVIWSWPSELMEHRYRLDVRAKNVRCDADALYLAGLLRQCGPQTHVSLIGYSLGARVIGGGLHLLGGGSVAGRTLGAESTERAPMRAVLIAAAIDHDAFSPKGCFSLAPNMADQILVTVNPRDPAMKWYPLLDKWRSTQALGYIGPAAKTAGGELQTTDLSNCVGRHHRWRYYSDCPALTSLLGDYAFLRD